MQMNRLLTAALLSSALAAPAALAVGPPSGLPDGTNNPGTQFKPVGTPNGTDNPGTEHKPAGTPDGTNNPGAKRKAAAPGIYCKGESKKKAEGQQRSDFSTCVQAQAKLRSGTRGSPREACKDADKKHVEGEKGTAFSRCVSAAAKLLKDQKAQEEQATESD